METRIVILTIIIFCGSSNSITRAENQVDIATKVATESINELQNTAMIYSKIKSEEAALAGLKNSVRRQLKTKTSQFLANILCGGESLEGRRNIKQHLDVFVEDNETQLVEEILHDAISEVMVCKAPFEMVDLLWSLFQEGNSSSFELMIRSQLHLFHINDKKRDVGDLKFLRKFALNLYKIKQKQLYQSVNASLKQQIDNIITKLPTNLQYLLFYPYFCLMNAKYSEFIYTCMTKANIDASSRYVWTWHDKFVFTYDTGHIRANIFESHVGSNADVLVQLKGIKYDMFYYMMPQTQLIAGWELTSEPVNYIWSTEFMDNDRMAFYQHDYIMCATPEMYDPERRIVRGYKRSNYSSNHGECQWLLGPCNRK